MVAVRLALGRQTDGMTYACPCDELEAAKECKIKSDTRRRLGYLAEGEDFDDGDEAGVDVAIEVKGEEEARREDAEMVGKGRGGEEECKGPRGPG